MNFALFRYSFRRSFRLLLLFTALTCLYGFAVVQMYDPLAGSALLDLSKLLPQAMEILGVTSTANTYTAFIVNYLYSLLMLALPMLFTVLLSAQLIARHVSRGTIAYLLASPNSRRRIAATQRSVLIFDLFLMQAICCGALVGMSELFYPGMLELIPFLILSLCSFALQLVFAGLCFLVSCRSCSVLRTLVINAALCILFYTLHVLSGLGGAFTYLQYITPYTLINPAAILNGELQACLLPLILLVIAVILFLLASRSFKKRTFAV